MTVEFIGGPMDGEQYEMPDTQRYWRIPLRQMPDAGVMAIEEYVPAVLKALRCGIYAPVGNPREFHWHGEEDEYWKRTGKPR